MSAQSVESYVMSLLSTTFPDSGKHITKETSLVADLDADSMAMVTLIFAIDEELDGSGGSIGYRQLGRHGGSESDHLTIDRGKGRGSKTGGGLQLADREALSRRRNPVGNGV